VYSGRVFEHNPECAIDECYYIILLHYLLIIARTRLMQSVRSTSVSQEYQNQYQNQGTQTVSTLFFHISYRVSLYIQGAFHLVTQVYTSIVLSLLLIECRER